MVTVLLPPGGYPIAVNKYIKYQIYITYERHPLLLVSALLGCYLQGVLTVVKVVLSKWSVVCSTIIHWHNHTIIHWHNHTIIHWHNHTLAQSYTGTIIHWHNHTLAQSYNHSLAQSYNGTIIHYNKLIPCFIKTPDKPPTLHCSEDSLTMASMECRNM
jgi:hypothetical protein